MPTAVRQKSPGTLPWHLRLLRRTRRVGPPARYDVAVESALPVTAADGSVLLADHYLPVTDRPCPTILVRSPYGRGFPWSYLYGLHFAEQGFHVLLQSCRGTSGSGGEFEPYRNEAADGQAVVRWLRQQDWFAGTFATLGPSYLGYVQWALAVDPPPEWRAAVVQVGGHDPYDFFYPGGAFALEQALVGGMGLFHQGKGPLRYALAVSRLARTLRRVARALPLVDTYPASLGGRQRYFEDWLGHPDRNDPYWTDRDVGPTAERLTVPASLVSGWHDVLLGQTLQQYQRLRRAGGTVNLLVGPWTHTSLLDKGWPQVYGDALGWLRAYLADDPAGLRPTPVRVHVGGCDEWRDLADWPPPGMSVRRYHLHGDGSLVNGPAGPSTPSAFRYEPAAPTPSLGGASLSRVAGRRDNTRLEAREDVLVFSTAPLAEPVEVLGPVHAELHVSTSGPHADLFARLCDVDPDGRSYNVCDGLVRLDPASHPGPTAVTVPMSHAAYRFAAGHRIRLQVSGGAHPRFTRNTGTGEPFATTTRLVAVDTHVHHDPEHPSALLVPTAGDAAPTAAPD
jgi:putative CocE/NonD family hydrolase